MFERYDIAARKHQSCELRKTLPPFLIGDFSFYFKAPEPTLPSTYFLTVFNIDFWIGIIFIWAIVVATLMIYMKFKKLNLAKSTTMMMNFFGVSQEYVNVTSFAYKINFIIASLFAICMAASFSAFLISHLSVNRLTINVETLDDILDQDYYHLCIRTRAIPFKIIEAMSVNRSVKINPPSCLARKHTVTDKVMISDLRETICVHPQLVSVSVTFFMSTIMTKR